MKKFYKCLTQGCDRKLEKQYLYCSIECACYDRFIMVRRGTLIQRIILKIYQKIVYKCYMFLRNLDE